MYVFFKFNKELDFDPRLESEVLFLDLNKKIKMNAIFPFFNLIVVLE